MTPDNKKTSTPEPILSTRDIFALGAVIGFLANRPFPYDKLVASAYNFKSSEFNCIFFWVPGCKYDMALEVMRKNKTAKENTFGIFFICISYQWIQK